jgi:3-deoxy-D-manno-octulosonate 8-phosphate phosphatase (KDO 8-P phosphatase)
VTTKKKRPTVKEVAAKSHAPFAPLPATTLIVPPAAYPRAQKVKLLVFDVDGVLTDGGLHYGPDGELMKRFDVKDGHSFVMARLVGLPTGVLTARTSKIVETRMRELGVAHVVQGEKLKGPAFARLCADAGLEPHEVAYMGDDVNDLAPLAMAGLAACPSDAVADVRAVCQFVSSKPGGRGAARELVELILKLRGLWPNALAAVRGPPGA